MKWVRYPLAALGAYCLIGAFVLKHGWLMTALILLWPVVFAIIAPPPVTPQAQRPE